jgi:hypothetical protein
VRPGMTDQLTGIRRILHDIIAPELREGYPSQVLRGVVKNLSMLEGAWTRIVPFLEWDNAATADLLRDARPHLGAVLTGHVDRMSKDGITDGSPEALERRNDELRSLLADVIRELADEDQAGEVRESIKRHFVERSLRYPFRMAIAAPTSAKG